MNWLVKLNKQREVRQQQKINYLNQKKSLHEN